MVFYNRIRRIQDIIIYIYIYNKKIRILYNRIQEKVGFEKNIFKILHLRVFVYNSYLLSISYACCIQNAFTFLVSFFFKCLLISSSYFIFFRSVSAAAIGLRNTSTILFAHKQNSMAAARS